MSANGVGAADWTELAEWAMDRLRCPFCGRNVASADVRRTRMDFTCRLGHIFAVAPQELRRVRGR